MKTPLELLQLRERLNREGYFVRCPAPIFAELSFYLMLTALGLTLWSRYENLVPNTIAVLFLALSGMGVSTNAHTASHNAVSQRRWVNQLLVYFGYPFFLQVSAHFWRHKHLLVHHHHPNIVGRDDDIDLLPYFALTKDKIAAASPGRRRYFRWQWILVPLFMVGNSLNVIITGWRFLIRELRDPAKRSSAHWIDLALLLAHLALWIVVPALFVPLADVLILYGLRLALISYGMFAFFAPAHFPAEAICFDEKVAVEDPVLMQTATTVNYDGGALARLFCGGVQYQVEHHLFPSISHVHYPAVSRWVESFCKSRGLPYRRLSWPAGIGKSLWAFYELKPTFNTIAEARAYLRAKRDRIYLAP